MIPLVTLWNPGILNITIPKNEIINKTSKTILFDFAFNLGNRIILIDFL